MTYRPSGSGAALSSYVVIQYCICTGHDNKTFTYLLTYLVREPAIGLIKWLRPKGLKVCYYVEKYAEFKNQTLKNRLVHKSAMRNGIPPG